VWWCKPVIPALRKLRQEDYEFRLAQPHSESLSIKKKERRKEGGREGGRKAEREGGKQEGKIKEIKLQFA
jgi:hypothetical protein